jgi:hypothetical protein
MVTAAPAQLELSEPANQSTLTRRFIAPPQVRPPSLAGVAR